MNTTSKAYLVGCGIGSLAAAAFMIRDGNVPGRNISILEALPVMGGSLDGAGDPTLGYSMRGGKATTRPDWNTSHPTPLPPSRSILGRRAVTC
jgi:oleate hydratase